MEAGGEGSSGGWSSGGRSNGGAEREGEWREQAEGKWWHCSRGRSNRWDEQGNGSGRGGGTARGGRRRGGRSEGCGGGAVPQGGVDVTGWDDVFLADVGVTWQGLGLQGEVEEAMCRAGFKRPSAIQVRCEVVWRRQHWCLKADCVMPSAPCSSPLSSNSTFVHSGVIPPTPVDTSLVSLFALSHLHYNDTRYCVQAGAIPQILSGSDVVVAAETGSGKTHAYLAPVLSHVLTWREEERRREMAEREEGRAGEEEGSEGRSEGRLGEDGEVGEVRRRRVGARKFALVLCPNAALCRQVGDERMRGCVMGRGGV
ncbi:unnamed protein product [Closterium sp. Yama58-4]|nr:unnamed protein product [Closterium sp. Yama58-4]